MPSTVADNRAAHIAVAVIRDAAGRILISRRATQVHQGGLWEFPGGKIAAGETSAAALRRELREELGIDLVDARPLIRVPHQYPDRAVVLNVWEVTRYTGQPHGREGQPVQWVTTQALAEHEFPAANRPILRAIALPSLYLITPEPGAGTAGFLASLERAVSAGIRLVQLRVKQPREDLPRLAREAARRCEAAGATLLLNGHPGLAAELSGVGVHLTSTQLWQHRQRPLPAQRLVAASCHGPADIQRATELEADFAVLGPVQPTRSHPDAQVLGWTAFAELCAAAALPIYALGGLAGEDVTRARAEGGQGVAAIRGLWPERVG